MKYTVLTRSFISNKVAAGKKIYLYISMSACALFLTPCSLKAQAQQDYLHCGTADAMDELFRLHPEVKAQHEQLVKDAQQNMEQFKLSHPNTTSTAPSYIIPIVFHIIHQYGGENISDAQVQDQVNILNRDYRLLNADASNASAPFIPLQADTKIEFRLATKDPEGNCTNGIDRIYSHRTNSANDDSKLNPWPRERYLNVWVVKTIGSQGVAGYAYYPSGVTGILFTIDGVLILNDYIGSIGTSNVNQSRALTHEIGHYLNLPHVWGSNNSPGVACGDDGMGDTPITKGWLTCPGLQPPLYMNRVVCSLPNDTIVENVENYMEYSYCSIMFTVGQRTAMQQTLGSAVSYRNNLPTYANHVATGTDTASLGSNPYSFPSIIPSLPTCVPIADFTANRYYICQGGTVTFTDRSWKAPVSSRTWNIPNGTPSTSTVASPTITFNTWGWQTISLTATNGTGSDTKTWTNCVFVAPPWYDYFGTFYEGFENNNFANGLWITENSENSYPAWQQNSLASYSGSNSVRLTAYGTDKGLIDAFISPSFNLSTCSNASLNFKYSCATSATSSTNIQEVLRIYSSSNCGQSWSLRKVINGVTLANAGYSASGFIPNSQSLWANCTIPLVAGDLQPNVRFRFEYTSGAYSNNIYIDDINISGTVGENEMSNYSFDLNVYPNPTNGEDLVNIGYTLVTKEKVSISLVDMIGREVVVMNSELENPGEKIITIDKQALGLKAGVYLVKISNGASYATRKLVITN